MKNKQRGNGRDRQVTARAEKWADVLKQFHGSGQTRKAFAEQQDVALGTLSYWLAREKGKKLKAVVPSPMVFGEIQMGAQGLPAEPNWAMEVVSPTGFTVRSRETLPAGLLIRVLRAR